MASKSKPIPRLQDQYDKRVGITYVYETVSRWVPELKQSRSTRKLIGKRDPETGEIVPTDQRMRKAKHRKAQQAKTGDLVDNQKNAVQATDVATEIAKKNIQLIEENHRLKRLLAEAEKEKALLRDLAEGNF